MKAQQRFRWLYAAACSMQEGSFHFKMLEEVLFLSGL